MICLTLCKLVTIMPVERALGIDNFKAPLLSQQKAPMALSARTQTGPHLKVFMEGLWAGCCLVACTPHPRGGGLSGNWVPLSVGPPSPCPSKPNPICLEPSRRGLWRSGNKTIWRFRGPRSGGKASSKLYSPGARGGGGD